MKLPNTVKARNHFALFAQNTPFKPKTERNRKAYVRKPKHQPKGW